jgi:hypothetical protein
MTDPNERPRKHVEEEAFEKLRPSQGHELLLVLVGAVLPPESDLVVLHRDEPFVGSPNIPAARLSFQGTHRPFPGMLCSPTSLRMPILTYHSAGVGRGRQK